MNFLNSNQKNKGSWFLSNLLWHPSIVNSSIDTTTNLKPINTIPNLKSTAPSQNQPTTTQISQPPLKLTKHNPLQPSKNTKPPNTTHNNHPKNIATTTARERREIRQCARWWRARLERPKRPGWRDGGERDQRDLDNKTTASEIEQSLTEVRSRSASDTTNSTTQTQNSTNNPPKTPTQLTHLLS